MRGGSAHIVLSARGVCTHSVECEGVVLKFTINSYKYCYEYNDFKNKVIIFALCGIGLILNQNG